LIQIFFVIETINYQKRDKKNTQKPPKKTPKKMEGEDRHDLLLWNEYYDSLEEDDGEYRTTLLTAKEYQDALVWDLQDLIETMNKLAI